MTQNQKMACPICATDASLVGGSGITFSFDCPICGHFKILSRVIEDIKGFPKHILSGVARNYWEMNQAEFNFSDKNCESTAAFFKAVPYPIPSETDIPAKADLILSYLKRKSNFPGEYISVLPTKLYSVAFCRTAQEFCFCVEYLKEQKMISQDRSTSGTSIRITPDGWAYLSGVGAEVKEQGFIAMSFKPELKPVSESGLYPGIEKAGYKPLRIDRKDHNNRIDDEIVAEIRKSRFVVADLTGKNAGAYFEAGFAMGLGKPVIWTCQQSEIDEGNVHFDTRQYSIVSWEPDKLDDFAKRLTQRIEATIGRGRYVVDAK